MSQGTDETRTDTAESPGSERETQALQDDPDRSRALDDVDPDAVRTLPGTGGPDDDGDVEVPDDTVKPRSAGADAANRVE